MDVSMLFIQSTCAHRIKIHQPTRLAVRFLNTLRAISLSNYFGQEFKAAPKIFLFFNFNRQKKYNIIRNNISPKSDRPTKV